MIKERLESELQAEVELKESTEQKLLEEVEKLTANINNQVEERIRVKIEFEAQIIELKTDLSNTRTKNDSLEKVKTRLSSPKKAKAANNFPNSEETRSLESTTELWHRSVQANIEKDDK